ncbi:hypothetical protein JCGZ_05095 [Jatropha curcas]|uniref:Uncharacterized protein n=1 Tax=Jatropha curcas TaxID=180498 RepID=A0A067LI40_JATCU|nr:hypothetical protein JCGZ_05095 [Jatropha curcas]
MLHIAFRQKGVIAFGGLITAIAISLNVFTLDDPIFEALPPVDCINRKTLIYTGLLKKCIGVSILINRYGEELLVPDTGIPLPSLTIDPTATSDDLPNDLEAPAPPSSFQHQALERLDRIEESIHQLTHTILRLLPDFDDSPSF